MNLNKVFILGRLTADPQLRTTPSGQQVTNFSLATNRVWTDKSGMKQEEAEFHNIVVWGRQAEVATQFLTKGGLALVEGRLRTRTWQDQQGQSRRTTEIIADRIQLGPRRQPQAPINPVSPTQEAKEPAGTAEIPVINLEVEEKEIKPEDMPF